MIIKNKCSLTARKKKFYLTSYYGETRQHSVTISLSPDQAQRLVNHIFVWFNDVKDGKANEKDTRLDDLLEEFSHD